MTDCALLVNVRFDFYTYRNVIWQLYAQKETNKTNDRGVPIGSILTHVG